MMNMGTMMNCSLQVQVKFALLSDLNEKYTAKFHICEKIR